MVEWWWLIIAASVGFLFGFAIMGAIAAGSEEDEKAGIYE